MSYKIECVITSISSDGKVLVKGTEGYLLRHEGKEYNVFFPAKSSTENFNVFVQDSKIELLLYNGTTTLLDQMLILAKCNNRKVSLNITFPVNQKTSNEEVESSKNLNEKSLTQQIEIKSVTIL
jgi:hypothetical protein